MGIVARLYDFVAGTKIRSAQVDAELDNLVLAHNTLNTELTTGYETLVDLTTNRKLSASGNFTGTLNGYPIVAADPGLSSTVTALQAENTKRGNKYITLEMYGGVADALYQDPVTYEWYTSGAKTTLATDNTSALTAALADIKAGTDWTLVITGVFCIRGTSINVTGSSINIIGQGINTSKLVFTHLSGGLYFNDPSGNGYIYQIHIEEVAFSGSNKCNTLLRGLKCEEFYFHNVYIGETLDSPMVWEQLNLTHFSILIMSNCANGLILKNCGFVSFNHHNFFDVQNYNIKIFNGIASMNIYDGWAEQFDTFLKVEADAGSSVGLVNIENNRFNSVKTHPKILDISVSNALAINATNININRNAVTFTAAQNVVGISNTHSGSIFILNMHNNYLLLTGDYATNRLVNTTINANFNFIFTFDGSNNFLNASNIAGNGTEVGINMVNGLVRPKGGLYLYDNPSSLKGHLKWDATNNRILMRDSESFSYQYIPIRGASIGLSTATDVAGLKTDLNALITALKASWAIQ